MKKLKHVQTSIANGDEYFLICIDNFACLDSWNHFSSLNSAEEYLISHFSPSKTKKYSIAQVKICRLEFLYK